MSAAFPFKTDVSSAASTRNMTTLNAVKDELQITVGTHDAWLLEKIAAASAEAVAYCGREFVAETLIDRFRLEIEARSIEELWLSRWPVSSITTVVEDGVTLTSDDYEFDPETGQVWRLDAGGDRTCWAPAVVTITFVGGYALKADLPRDLEQAVIGLVKLKWFARSRDPLVKGEEIPGVARFDYWVGGLPGGAAWPAEISDALDRYRRIAV